MRRPLSFPVRDLRTHCGSARQSEGHSFGDHLINESVGVTEASLYSAQFYVSMARVSYNLQQRCFIDDCYVKKLIQIVKKGKGIPLTGREGP
jgi:hypothetical protein